MTTDTVIDRLLARVSQQPGPLESDCWVWMLKPDHHGYAAIYVGPGKRGAHRVAYEHLVGPIPDGMQLDHLCRVRTCVNPDHLEPVTQTENVRRGMSPTVVAARSNTCLKGHSMEDAYRNGRWRSCRVCRELRQTRRTT